MKNIIKTLNTISEMLAKNFKRFARRPAMVLEDGKEISYNDMRWDIFKTSNILRFFSGSAPKAVAVFIDNSPETVETIYSVLAIGAKAVLLRYTMSEDEIKTALFEQQPDIIFIRAEKISLLGESPCASVLEIADNRVLKKVNKTMHKECIQKAVSYSKNDERVIAVTYSHGLESTTLTRKDFVALAEKKERKNKKCGGNEKTFDALVEYIGRLVNAFVTGKAVSISYN